MNEWQMMANNGKWWQIMANGMAAKECIIKWNGSAVRDIVNRHETYNM